MRIVSLIASATEITHALGLGPQQVGRSHECDYPPEVSSLPILSAPKVDPALPGDQIDTRVREIVAQAMSVYRVDVDTLEQLQPDLILTQDHCEVCAVSLRDVRDALCQLTDSTAEICTLHPGNLEDVFADIDRVARAAGVQDAGERLNQTLHARLRALEERAQGIQQSKRVALIEWLEPPMVAGGWMPELATLVGAHPVIVEDPTSFRTVNWNDIVAARPDHIVVMPCGYDVERTRQELRRAEIAGNLKACVEATGAVCHIADGNAYFNRPGPRLVDTAELLAGLLYPDVFADFAEEFKDASVAWP